MEEAVVLTRFAKRVSVIHRRDSLKASSIMQQKAKENLKIDFIFNSEILEILGDKKVEKIKLRTFFTDKSYKNKTAVELTRYIPQLALGKIDKKDGEGIVWELPIDGVFVAIGHSPNSKVFKGIDVDSQGYIVEYKYMKTNIEGVFVAGDVKDMRHQQAIAAAGSGCAAALEAQGWLEQDLNLICP